MRSSTALTWPKIEATFENGYDGPDIYVVFSGGENGDSLIHENGYSLEDCKRFFDGGDEFFLDKGDALQFLKEIKSRWEKEFSMKYGGELELDYLDGNYYVCAFHNEPKVIDTVQYDSWLEPIKEVECLGDRFGNSEEIEAACIQLGIPYCH